MTSEPGLYSIGLNFLHAFSSTMVHGVGRDAAYVARAVAARTASQQAHGAAHAVI